MKLIFTALFTAFLSVTACAGVGLQFSDPFGYCLQQVNTDLVSAANEPLPEILYSAMVQQGLISKDAPKAYGQHTQWRCMDRDVYVCLTGANLPCAEQADASKVPSKPLMAFCATHSNAEVIPAAVTGRATLYSWACDQEMPVAVEKVFSVDNQGYIANFWYKLVY